MIKRPDKKSVLAALEALDLLGRFCLLSVVVGGLAMLFRFLILPLLGLWP